MQAHLACIETAEENEFLRRLLKAMRGKYLLKTIIMISWLIEFDLYLHHNGKVSWSCIGRISLCTIISVHF